jgi:hypothetical protein
VLLARSVVGMPVRHAIALWVLFTTLYLHRVGASFVRVSAAQHGRAGLRRNWLPLAIAAAAIGGTAWTVFEAIPQLTTALTTGAIGSALRQLRAAPVIRVVFWPFHALIAPVFAHTAAEWSGSIGWALVLLVACYIWVVRTGVAFEEAAMQRAERVAAQRAARRLRGDIALRASRVWPPLAPTGRPAMAIAWKVVVAFQRLVPLTRAAVLTLIFVGVILLSMPGVPFGAPLMGTGMLLSAALLAAMGPLFVRTDLQQDMLVLSLLRSYPLSGRANVAAEIAGTVALLSVAQAACVVVGFALLAPWTAQWVRDGDLTRVASGVPVVIAALIATPAVTALRVAVANAWAVLLPGWVHLGPGRSGGIESLGQNLLRVIGSMFVHLLLLALPAIAGVIVYAVLKGMVGTGAFIPAAIVGSAVAAGELWFIVEWLGAVLVRTDPSAVEAATAS